MPRGGLLALIALIVLAILVALFLGLCRQSGTDQAATATATTSAATSAATTAPKTAATTAPTTAAAKAGTAGGAGASDFAAIMGRFKDAEYKVTYEMSGAGLPGGTMTISHLKDRQRMEFVAQGSSVIVLQLPDKSYFCLAEARSCFDAGAAGLGASGPGANPVVGALQDFEKNAPGYTARQVDQRRIAGVDARCYEFSGQGVTGLTCLGADGQLLLADTATAAGTFKLTATKIEGKPAASEFEPPYPVTTFPGFGGPGGPGAFPTPPRP